MDLNNIFSELRSQLSNRDDSIRSIESQTSALSQAVVSSPMVNPATWAYDHLQEIVKEFEGDLDDEHEIGLKIVSLGQTGLYHVQDIDYWPPYILVFRCLDSDGAKVTLIQHHTQLNFLLTALPKADAQRPARRVGFAVQEDGFADSAKEAAP